MEGTDMNTSTTRPEDNDIVLKFDMSDVDIPELLYQEMKPGLRENVYFHVLFDNKRTIQSWVQMQP